MPKPITLIYSIFFLPHFYTAQRWKYNKKCRNSNSSLTTSFHHLFPRKRKPDAVPLRRKQNEKQAADHPHRHRQRRQDLPRLLRWRRVEAADHILVKHRHSRKNHDRHDSMHEIHDPQAIFHRLLRRERDGAVHHPDSAEGGDAVPHLAPLVPEAVGEAHGEARGGAEGEDGGGGRLADEGLAFAFMRDDRRQKLECKNGAGREEVREMSRPLERLPDNLLPRRLRRFSRSRRRRLAVQDRPLAVEERGFYAL